MQRLLIYMILIAGVTLALISLHTVHAGGPEPLDSHTAAMTSQASPDFSASNKN